METGGAAVAWLDGRLSADARWADGVPDDAPPWIATAFADVATMTIDELVLVADALAEAGLELDALGEFDGTAVDEFDVSPTGGDTGWALDEWLSTHADFEDASTAPRDAIEVADTASRLSDPFDHLVGDDSAHVDVDIVTDPSSRSAAGEPMSHDEAPVDDIAPSAGRVAAVDAPTSRSEPSIEHGSPGPADLPDADPTGLHTGSFMLDPFDATDLDIPGATDIGSHDGIHEFDDDIGDEVSDGSDESAWADE